MQLAILVQRSLKSSQLSPIVIASAALGLVGAITLAALSTVEHRNTLRPSFLITIYLMLSILFDIVRTRTAWLQGDARAVAGTTTTAVILKLAVLVFETVNKRSILLDTYRRLSKEATSGLLSRSLFIWLASLLKAGAKGALNKDDLLGIHESLDPQKLAAELGETWGKCK